MVRARALLVLAGIAPGVGAQSPEVLARYPLDLESPVGAAIVGRAVYVLDGKPSPHAVYRLHDGPLATFGGKGEGPGELRSPVDIAADARGIVVADIGLNRLAGYDLRGRSGNSHPIAPGRINTVAVILGDTLVGTFAPMIRDGKMAVGGGAITRIAGEHREVIWRSTTRVPQEMLQGAGGGPSLTVRAPFADEDRWASLPGVGVVTYSAGSGQLELRDTRGSVIRTIPLPAVQVAVTPADRAGWLDAVVGGSSLLRSQPEIFEGLRLAAEKLRYPAHHPPVLALLGDPGGSVWIKRRPASSGEQWSLVGADGKSRGELALPARHRLLAVGAEFLVAVAPDDDDLHEVRILARPGT